MPFSPSHVLIVAGMFLLAPAALLGFMQARQTPGSAQHTLWRVAHSGGTAGAVQLLALGAVLVELAGVVGVGLWTVLDPGMFAHDTVWSRFGAGYGYVPLVLPVVGLIWLLTHRPARPAEAGAL